MPLREPVVQAIEIYKITHSKQNSRLQPHFRTDRGGEDCKGDLEKIGWEDEKAAGRRYGIKNSSRYCLPSATKEIGKGRIDIGRSCKSVLPP